MKVYRYLIPADVERAALDYMRRARFGKADLVPVVRGLLPADAHELPLDIANAIADRLIQRERIAGNLRRAPSMREWPALWQWAGE